MRRRQLWSQFVVISSRPVSPQSRDTHSRVCCRRASKPRRWNFPGGIAMPLHRMTLGLRPPGVPMTSATTSRTTPRDSAYNVRFSRSVNQHSFKTYHSRTQHQHRELITPHHHTSSRTISHISQHASPRRRIIRQRHPPGTQHHPRRRDRREGVFRHQSVNSMC
jgi:hypothetical protein